MNLNKTMMVRLLDMEPSSEVLKNLAVKWYECMNQQKDKRQIN